MRVFPEELECIVGAERAEYGEIVGKVNDTKRSASVSLSFTGTGGSYIIVTGKARLIKEKDTWEEHWDKSLNQWFKKGIDTPGLVLIAVKATHIKYWDKYKEREIKLS